nr:hypothetical protein Iba_chr13fCG4350 [Ipomoea batatas]
MMEMAQAACANRRPNQRPPKPSLSQNAKPTATGVEPEETDGHYGYQKYADHAVEREAHAPPANSRLPSHPKNRTDTKARTYTRQFIAVIGKAIPHSSFNSSTT